MTDITGALEARFQQQKDDAAAARLEAFKPDPELEIAGERMDRMRETNPKAFEDANFGDLRQQVETYRNRKADHERTTK